MATKAATAKAAPKKTRSKKDIYSKRVRLTRAEAIRANCIECMNFQVGEVNKCTNERCALWPFRRGTGEDHTEALLFGPSKYD